MLTLVSLAALAAASPAPDLIVTKDNTPVMASCRIVIPPGTIIADTDGNGVIQISGSDITVEFADGSDLWGGPRPTGPDEGVWDTYQGIGVAIAPGSKNITLRRLRVHGYKVGVAATEVESLLVDAADLSDNFRQRLRSTPMAEDTTDWLYPHRNDNNEWATKWGAALSVRSGKNITVRNVLVRRGQNGIMFHRVTDSKVYDNDCSFLSGWGLAMFRSSRNTITRNAFDFCVRGHSEGVYNRGQDSAGILMFEQCSENLIAENSVTHGGDGVFGFAGVEALDAEGQANPAAYDHARKGCNDNLFLKNDLSYAPAHGLEMTFSFGNHIIGNRFVENAITGIWGGYSQGTVISGNDFIGNGAMAYGLERGGVNMEHASGNLIIRNRFTNNKAAVHLWWDAHGDFESRTWGKANYRALSGNVIAGNTITIDASHPFKGLREGQKLLGIHLRQDPPPAAGQPAEKFVSTVYAGNTIAIDPAVGVETDITPGIALDTGATIPAAETPKYEPLGNAKPIGARAHLAGRHNIIMSQWGPWDHTSPMFRTRSISGGEHIYELFGAPVVTVTLDQATSDEVQATVTPTPSTSSGQGATGQSHRISFAAKPGVSRYTATITSPSLPNWSRKVSGVVVGASWDVKAFAWAEATDPKEHLDQWRALASSDQAISAKVPTLRFDYAHGGPSNQPWGTGGAKDAAVKIGPDRFGMIATAKVRFPKGKWKFTTLSDDGVRVLANGKPVLENWTWHAPTTNEGILELAEAAEVELVVEHFEIDGFAVLHLDISPVDR
ncbi:MAG: hypothetical protein HEQ23_05950 [Tepidisphaera sp.]